MIYKRLKDYLSDVSGSQRSANFECILSALLAAGAAVLATYSVVKSEEDSKQTTGSYISEEKMQQIYDPAVKVNKSYTLEIEVDGSKEINLFGSGVLLEDKSTGDLYVITANHVTSSDYYEHKDGKKFKAAKNRMEVESLEAKVVKKDESSADLALLKIDVPIGYDNAHFRPFTGKIAGELNENDYLIGAGYPAGEKNYFITRAKYLAENSTFVEIEIIGGNSGGGVYRLKDKRLELAGIVLRTQEISSLERLRELIKGTPLEDDYL